jgi:uncharacterized membrane protein YhaH (DUF805 family)
MMSSAAAEPGIRFFLLSLIVTALLIIVDAVTGLLNEETGYGLLSGLYSLAVLLPGIAVSVRRLHDTGKSGWWLLIAFIPILGAIVLLIFMITDSDKAPNAYGPSPKLTPA